MKDFHKHVVITQHAVEQFIRRWEPDLDFEKAKKELYWLLISSSKVGKTLLGDTIRESSQRSGVRMVMKERIVCVSVLPARNENLSQWQQEQWEALELERSASTTNAEAGITVETTKEKFTKELESLKAKVVSLEEEKVALRNRLNKIGEEKHQASNRIQSLESWLNASSNLGK